MVGFTVDQYQRLLEQGILPGDTTTELLRGAIVAKDRSVAGEDPSSYSPIHAFVVNRLVELVPRFSGRGCYLQIQGPVACPPDSVPEPDASVIRGRPRDYLDRYPGAADASCVIEVAHSSLRHDREYKLPIYAGAGVPQYVIVNLRNSLVEVYSDPDVGQERYGTKQAVGKDGRVEVRLHDGVLHIRGEEVLP